MLKKFLACFGLIAAFSAQAQTQPKTVEQYPLLNGQKAIVVPQLTRDCLVYGAQFTEPGPFPTTNIPSSNKCNFPVTLFFYLKNNKTNWSGNHDNGTFGYRIEYPANIVEVRGPNGRITAFGDIPIRFVASDGPLQTALCKAGEETNKPNDDSTRWIDKPTQAKVMIAGDARDLPKYTCFYIR